MPINLHFRTEEWKRRIESITKAIADLTLPEGVTLEVVESDSSLEPIWVKTRVRGVQLRASPIHGRGSNEETLVEVIRRAAQEATILASRSAGPRAMTLDPELDAPDMDDPKPTAASRGGDEVTKSFQLVMKLMAEQAADIRAIRFFLTEQGVTAEDFELVKSEIKKRWEAEVQPVIERIRERRVSEQLIELLNKAGDAKH